MDTQALEGGQYGIDEMCPVKMKPLMYFYSLDFDRIGFNLDIVLKWMKQNWISLPPCWLKERFE